MTNYAKLDHVNRTIVMDKLFAKNAAIVGTREYEQLQNCRRDYPNYTVMTRRIKTNPNKECYNGLTYAYMEDYIRTHEVDSRREQVLNEFDEMKLRAACHSKAFRYPTIKKWFLERYPEIKNFGVQKVAEQVNVVTKNQVDNMRGEEALKIAS